VSEEHPGADADAIDQLVEWGADPRKFVMDCFSAAYEEQHGKPLEPDVWQDDFLNALVTWETGRFALAACKGAGKSCGEAWAVLWFFVTRHNAQIVVCSITRDNLTTGLWKELAVWYALSPLLKSIATLAKESITMLGFEQSWFIKARSFPKDADSTQQSNTLAGLHSPHVMFVGDEAGDFPDGVVAAAEGIFANDVEAKLILAGNTTRTAGPLYRAARNTHGLWWVKRITGDPDNPGRCKRISLSYAKAVILENGRDHPWTKINILGEFPDVASDKLLGPDDIERAQQRNPKAEEFRREPVIIGIDTARQGVDQTVLCRRQGCVTFKLRAWRTADSAVLTAQIAGVLMQLEPKADAVFIDVGGPSGYAVLDGLNKLGFKVHGVDFGSDPVWGSPTAPAFLNRRAEMYWMASQWVKRVGSLPVDIELGVELTEPTYYVDQRGKQTKFSLEPKDEIKGRIGRSPDRGDSFVLTFAAPVLPASLRDTAQVIQSHEQKSFNPYEFMRRNGGR
jgi:hypothetical protein